MSPKDALMRTLTLVEFYTYYISIQPIINEEKIRLDQQLWNTEHLRNKYGNPHSGICSAPTAFEQVASRYVHVFPAEAQNKT